MKIAGFTVGVFTRNAMAQSWPPQEKTVTLIYNTGDAREAKDDVAIKLEGLPCHATGQTVMESAASRDQRFDFTCKYYNRTLGYSLVEIGDKKEDGTFYWELLVGSNGTNLMASPEGYSNWYPYNGSIMKWVTSKSIHLIISSDVTTNAHYDGYVSVSLAPGTAYTVLNAVRNLQFNFDYNSGQVVSINGASSSTSNWILWYGEDEAHLTQWKKRLDDFNPQNNSVMKLTLPD